MKLLLLSSGSRCSLVRYFQQALSVGSVVAADADPYSPALYAADRRYVVPPIHSSDYPGAVLSICQKERINGVLSLIDPELSVLARHEKQFAALGVRVIGSSCELCDFAYDKGSVYRWLAAHGYPTVAFWTEPEAFFRAADRGEVRFPVFIKPVRGSASVNAQRIADRETAAFVLSRQREMLIQECQWGQEIGADVYVDLLSGETVSVFTRKKLKMRSGETDKAVSFHDDRLFALIGRFVSETGFRGPLDIDLFESGGTYYITDVNPRFGGGYPHAHLCGCDHIKMILENLKGNVNPRRIGDYQSDVCMMKYCDVILVPQAMLVKAEGAMKEESGGMKNEC